MAMLKAIVSDKDGINHELFLKKRETNTGYSWYYGDVALVATQAATPAEALRILQREIAPPDRLQLIDIARPADDQP
jgi:hypothetical protein